MSGSGDGEEGARRLEEALRGGCLPDPGAVLGVLARGGGLHPSRLSLHYRRVFGKTLSTVITDELAGAVEQICLDLITERKEYIATRLYDILQEIPKPEERLLVALLSERSNKEVREIREAFLKKYKESVDSRLGKRLDGEGSGHLKILLNGKRSEALASPALAQDDARALVSLGLAVSYNGSGPVALSIMQSRSYDHLRGVFNSFHELTGGRHVWTKIEAHLPPSRKARLTQIMQAIFDPELYHASLLWDSRGSYKFAERLIEVRLSRDKEFLRAVNSRYAEAFDVRLSDDISSMTGHFSPLLLTLFDL